MESIQYLIDAIIQLLVFSLIPIIWWFFTDRNHLGFFEWIGFKKPIIIDQGKFMSVLVGEIFISLLLAFVVMPLFLNSDILLTSDFTGRGMSALLPALIYSFILTGLSEEIFFRGFLAKRLIRQFGLNIGNIVQGLLFGLIHGLIFYSLTRLLGVIAIIFITGLSGWLMGLLNEKYSNGSIVSSWLVHGIINLFTSLLAMFNLI